ncbi:MAG: hypothetical protein OXI22_13780, partial [Defluviicoccus sp.]|nr:hypothetical protein [Defluviicoccus sp.]
PSSSVTSAPQRVLHSQQVVGTGMGFSQGEAAERLAELGGNPTPPFHTPRSLSRAKPRDH